MKEKYLLLNKFDLAKFFFEENNLKNLEEIKYREKREILLVSSTSWTKDEVFFFFFF